jgi:hypothetical protein
MQVTLDQTGPGVVSSCQVQSTLRQVDQYILVPTHPDTWHTQPATVVTCLHLLCMTTRPPTPPLTTYGLDPWRLRWSLSSALPWCRE